MKKRRRRLGNVGEAYERSLRMRVRTMKRNQ
jgi:hypothetical protein